MPRLLILDVASNALDIAMRAQMAGWQVKWWNKPMPDGTCRLAGRGMIDRITDFNEVRRKWLDWADLIYLPDNVVYGPMLEPYRKLGYPIFGGQPEAAELELNRAAGQKAIADAGIPIMSSKAFTDYDAALSFAKKNPTYLVSKPSGDADKALSYVASDLADMEYMLIDRWKAKPEMRKIAKRDGFILQEKKVGVEMAVGGWFGPHGWSNWFYENWEYKKLMADDMGPNTGEMGTLSRMVRKSKLAEKVLIPLGSQLEKMGYVGFIDNACIIDKDGPWPMELTLARDGWPTRHNISAHVKNADPVQWMLDLLNGKDTMECVDGEVCVSIVVALPDFPYSKITNKELCGIPIRGGDDLDHVRLSEVMVGEAPVMVGEQSVRLPTLVTCGDYLAVVTGTGETITAARRSAYAAANKMRKTPGSPFFRPDIGAGRMKRDLPTLHGWGYAKGLEF